ncbi:MAG TPA: FAD-dependent oxidoreductase [Rhodopila sp.]|nr:FAD-dependent oxidoreductase [Rhodopila sp.]
MQRIVVLGAGFAGLWAALAAARARDEAALRPDDLDITVVDANAHHSIRVRNYESDLAETCIPLATVLDPVGIGHVQAHIGGIDVNARTVAFESGGRSRSISYDRLIVALGSRLARPPIPGLADYAFDVDTYAAGERLNRHIAGLANLSPADGRYAVLVVGAGLTGIEVATDVATRFQSLTAAPSRPRVILADHKPRIGSDMGDSARPVIAQALDSLGVETLPGVSVASIDGNGAMLADGTRIPAKTVIWCAGMKANPLAAALPVELDRLGRIPVDSYLRVVSIPGVFAAGDIAALSVDDTHSSVMSCQHSRPMGRFAGHNAVADLLGRPMLSLQIPWYTTILDLGGWGAVYTEGWDRQVVATGAAAKRTKEIINRQRIYPPLNGDRKALLDAAAPVVQTAPQRFSA